MKTVPRPRVAIEPCISTDDPGPRFRSFYHLSMPVVIIGEHFDKVPHVRVEDSTFWTKPGFRDFERMHEVRSAVTRSIGSGL